MFDAIALDQLNLQLTIESITDIEVLEKFIQSVKPCFIKTQTIEQKALNFFKRNKHIFKGVIATLTQKETNDVVIPFMLDGVNDRVVFNVALNRFTHIIVTMTKGPTTTVEGLPGGFSNETESKEIPIPVELGSWK